MFSVHSQRLDVHLRPTDEPMLEVSEQALAPVNNLQQLNPLQRSQSRSRLQQKRWSLEKLLRNRLHLYLQRQVLSPPRSSVKPSPWRR